MIIQLGGNVLKRSKAERHELLQEKITESPFVTDEDLSQMLGVSIQTIRLDRLELSIPEVRERIKLVAENNLTDSIRSLPVEEIIGEIIDIVVGERAISIFEIKAEHVFKRNQIARGHHLFAQANSLAVAIVDDELALTAKANIRFTRPVHEGDRVVAKANVRSKTGHPGRVVVQVESFVEQNCVFNGDFEMFHRKFENE